MNAAEKAQYARLDRQWLAAHGICQRCRTEPAGDRVRAFPQQCELPKPICKCLRGM